MSFFLFIPSNITNAQLIFSVIVPEEKIGSTKCSLYGQNLLSDRFFFKVTPFYLLIPNAYIAVITYSLLKMCSGLVVL